VCGGHEKLSIRSLAKIEKKTNWKKKALTCHFLTPSGPFFLFYPPLLLTCSCFGLDCLSVTPIHEIVIRFLDGGIPLAWFFIPFLFINLCIEPRFRLASFLIYALNNLFWITDINFFCYNITKGEIGSFRYLWLILLYLSLSEAHGSRESFALHQINLSDQT